MPAKVPDLTITAFRRADGSLFVTYSPAPGLDPADMIVNALEVAASITRQFGAVPQRPKPTVHDEPLDDFPPPGYPGPIFTRTEDYPDGEYD